MRVPLEKIGGMRRNEKDFVVTAYFVPSKRGDIKVEGGKECLFCVNSKQIL